MQNNDLPPLPAPDVLHEVRDRDCLRCHARLRETPPIKLGYTADQLRAYARAALAAAPVPAGWKLVPVEATEAMMLVGEEAFCATARPGATWAEHTGSIYRAMLAAAPVQSTHPADVSKSGASVDMDAPAVPAEPVQPLPINRGHGHVRPRPDGVRARCGGPAICRVCHQEQASLAQPAAQPSAEPVALLEECRDAFANSLRYYGEPGSRDVDVAAWNERIRRACNAINALLDAAPAAQPLSAPPFDILAHLQRQAEFSARTFGPGARVEGVTDHIAKELREVRESGGDLSEWVDVIILAFDGAWRSGASPQQIIDAIVAKQTKNEGRKWPDWRTAPADKAIEHDRSGDGGIGERTGSGE